MPKITKIEQQKKNSRRYSIYINEEFSFGVHEDTLVKFKLAKGMELDNDFIEQILKEEEQNKANNYALRLLSYRMRSKKEIITKMHDKGYENNIIDRTISYLNQYGYINDREYALSYIKDSMSLKKLGHHRIKAELFQKGISKDLIEEALSQLKDNDEEYEHALELAEKKLNGSYKNDDRVAQYRKIGSFLQRKGYSYDIITKILNRLLKN